MGAEQLPFKHIHFIGVGGIGMSAIAEILLDLGYSVSGSDLAASERLDRLKSKGANIMIGQRAENITDDMDIVVHSTAIRENNPERIAAKEKNIPIMHRSEMLGYLMQQRRAVCVAGSHGKTTTSSMIALILEKCQLDPTIVVGGVIHEIGSNAKSGQSDLLVAEADESDGSFLNLHPWYTIVTNIEEDHLDHYKNIDEIRSIFEAFVKKTASDGHILLCADCDETMKMKTVAPAAVTTYGFSEKADYQIKNHVQNGMLNVADIFYQDNLVGHLELSVPGAHNIANATAALVCALHFGLSFDQISEVLKEFHGTKRRFQLAGIVSDIQVIDDYAHHPTEIRATIQAAKDCHDGRVIAVFQPHRYTRTQFLAKQFAASLAEADSVYLLDVYPAGEDPIPGVSSQLIVDALPESLQAKIVKEDALPVAMTEIAKPGDMILVMGAGSIWLQAPKIVEALKEHYIN